MKTAVGLGHIKYVRVPERQNGGGAVFVPLRPETIPPTAVSLRIVGYKSIDDAFVTPKNLQIVLHAIVVWNEGVHCYNKRSVQCLVRFRLSMSRNN